MEEKLEQIKELLLKNFHEKDVDSFLIEVDCLFRERAHLLKNSRDHAIKLEDMRTHFERTISDLRTIAGGKKFNILPQTKMSDMEGDNGFERLDTMVQTVDKACEAHDLLTDLLEIIDKSLSGLKQKKGRPQVDQDGIIEEISIAYEKYIEKPTKYRDGVFQDVIRVLFDYEDPTRAIQKAISK